MLHLTAKTAMTFSVVINELATNAAKHGALREEDGRILINWEVDDSDILFTWTEHTSNPVETEREAEFRIPTPGFNDPLRTGRFHRVLHSSLPGSVSRPPYPASAFESTP